MDKVLFILLCGLNFLYGQKSYTKVNTSKELDICIMTDSLDVQNPDIIFKIINKSDKKFIIDPLGFYGKSIVYEDGIQFTPFTHAVRGYQIESTDESCSKDILIIKPYEEIEARLNTNWYDRGIYKYSKDHSYIKIVTSNHDKYTIRYSGCGTYIDKLVNEGYNILTDSLNIKIPLRNYK